MNRTAWLLVAATFAAGSAQAACYSIYTADGTLLQETATTPVDLQHQIGDTVPLKFGAGATMVISEGGAWCRDRSEDLSAQKSLAAAVLAEEKKAMVVKAAAVKAQAAAAVPVVKEAWAKGQVARQEGDVLTIRRNEVR